MYETNVKEDFIFVFKHSLYFILYLQPFEDYSIICRKRLGEIKTLWKKIFFISLLQTAAGQKYLRLH